MMTILNLFFGILFGFILSRVGATQYDLIANMFLLKNLHLMGVIGGGVVVGAIGIQIIKRAHLKTITGEEIKISPKDRHWGNVIGGLIFGLGWGITGSCPGTILTQLGEGKLAALFSLAGMILGTYLFGVLYPKLEHLATAAKKQ